MNFAIRSFVGFGALAVTLCLLSTPATADTPTMPKESYKKTADTDVKFLQERLGDLAKKQAGGMNRSTDKSSPARRGADGVRLR